MRAIVAQNLRAYIGLNNELPWYSPDDLKYFKEKTTEGSGAIIVGFKTAQTLPFLKNRIAHIVNTRDGNWHEELKQFTEKYPDAWIIGGAKTYKLLLHLIDEVHISLIMESSIGDTLIPIFNVHQNQNIKIINNNFKGVSNFKFVDEIVSTARNKKHIVSTIYTNNEENHILISVLDKNLQIKGDLPLSRQSKEVKEFIYNYITT